MRYRELLLPMLVVLPIALFQASVISEFQQLPGPVFGGDVYWHYGDALNMYLGGMPWENPQVPDEYAYYGWLIPLMIAALAKLTTMSVMSAYLYLAPLMTILSAAAMYLLSMKVFKDRTLSLMSAFSWVGFTTMYATCVGIMAWSLFLPLFLAALINLSENPTTKNKITAGIAQGLVSLAHVVAFPATMLLTTVIFLQRTLTWRIEFKPEDGRITVKRADGAKERLTENLRAYAPMALIGTSIALLFFAPIIFAYRGQTPNPLNEYTRPDFEKYGVEHAIDTLQNTFLNLDAQAGAIIISLLTLIGLYFALTERNRFLTALTAAGMLGGFHYFLTLPTIGFALIPEYFYGSLMRVGAHLLFIYGIASIGRLAGEAGKKDLAYYAVIMLAAALIMAQTAANWSESSEDRWVLQAKETQSTIFEMAEWVRENTDRDDVFLSNDELSFALNGLTARKVVVSRRTHFSPYLDVFQRTADAAVMLYGNDSEKRTELLEKYDIKYFYYNTYWGIQINEPPMVPAEERYREYLARYGIEFIETTAPLTPTWDGRTKTYDVYIINPYSQIADDFISRLTPVKEFAGEEELHQIYKVSVPRP